MRTGTEFGDPAAVPPTLDAESALTGVAMHLDATRAAALLTGIADDDIGNPQLVVVMRLIRQLAIRGVDPAPAAVIAEAQLTGEITGRERLTLLGRVVLEAYTGAASNNLPLAGHYRLVVLGDALGRTMLKVTARLTQAAEDLPPEQRGRVIDTAVADLRAAWSRWLTAGGQPDERTQGAA